jgi:RNA polymerase subunit RPABC4/transcription elongation factor Spt4
MTMNLNFAEMNQYVLIAISFAAAFTAALWLSLIIWVSRDIKKRSRDALAQILSILVAIILFLPGIVIYLILRPQNTLEETYQQTLEEEALLQAIEENIVCPGCSRRVQENWIVCPNCHTKLKKKCEHCSQLMALPWNICPYCATPVSGTRPENFDQTISPGLPNHPNLTA